MTTVSLFKVKGRLCGFQIKGHTGYAQAGEDIVCAALSFLSITCANALEQIAKVIPDTDTDEETGYLKVQLEEHLLNKQTDTIFQVFHLGVQQLSDSYPEYIRIL
ncbi:MAG: ribosomal-processing cysteine protease Prp [Eubacteriales bacterium]|nr:ribosomal-processing cysteine protease Prp [Eubacteriales bacterium]